MHHKVSGNRLFVLEGIIIAGLTEAVIAGNSSLGAYTDQLDTRYIYPSLLELNAGVFYNKNPKFIFSDVTVSQENGSLLISCGCGAETNKLCEHQAAVLLAILKKR